METGSVEAMGRVKIGKEPLSNAEKQRRWREKIRQDREWLAYLELKVDPLILQRWRNQFEKEQGEDSPR